MGRAGGRVFRMRLLALGCLLFASNAFAAGEFYSANPGSAPPASVTGDSVAGVVETLRADYVAYCTATWGGSIGTGDAQVKAGPTYLGLSGSTHTWSYTLTCERTNGGTVSDVNGSVTATEDSCPDGSDPTSGGECVVPSVCDETITGNAYLRPISSADSQGNICHESSQCKMTATNVIELSSGAGLIEYTGTSDSCTTEPEEPIDQANELTNCINSGSDTYCTEPTLADQNCGYLNDQYLCLDAIPDGNCTFYGNGDMACDDSASTPPAPDNGTAGVAATPDTTINLNGDTYNIFNNGTVAGSAGDASGTQQGDNPADSEINVELDFSEIIEQEPDSGIYVTPIDALTTQTGTELDDVATDIGDGTGFAVTNNVGDSWTSIFGYTYSCSNIDLLVAGQTITLECSELADLRSVLAWIASVIFFIAVFNLVMGGPKT